MPHQIHLCKTDPTGGCENGNNSRVAEPGHSSHQAGAALDFANMDGEGSSSSCSGRARRTSDKTWMWLRDNAEKYGFKQYSGEAWHWDPLPAANRCGAGQP
jgi:D-alanyl-D-alanine carboxypeptidase